MLKPNRAELDYQDLARKARRLQAGVGQKLKIALLADVSTQHLVPVLRALFASNGVDAHIYEAGFDTVQLEAFNPASGLYAFEPQLVVVIQSVTQLRGRYYESTDRAGFSGAKVDAIEGVWQAIQSHLAVPIIQSTFVIPYERAHGHFGAKVAGTLPGAISEINRDLCERAQRHASVFICDIDYLAAWAGRRHFFDERLWALAKSLCSLELLPEVAQSIVDIAMATLGRGIKCVVLDLDNTLWGGVIGDDGMDGIGLGDLDEGGAFRFFQLFLRSLWERGILLAVCSKNTESTARRVFQEHPAMVLREEHIAVFVANWEDKAANIRMIRQTLNIGFDSMVFLDDNPFERNLVRQLVPEILVPDLPEDPGLYVRAICELNLFESAAVSALDSQRTAMYQTAGERESEKQHFADLASYLKSLGTRADLRRFEPPDLGRIAQLIQRSNQFNLTTRRYSHSQCEALMNDERHCYPFSITVRDRFGDFGLIAVIVLKRHGEMLEIDTFLMSCRVLQRGVEQHAMNHIVDHARAHNCKTVLGRYIPTPKNSMVQEFFAQFGFERGSDGGEAGTQWRLDVGSYTPREVFINAPEDTKQ